MTEEGVIAAITTMKSRSGSIQYCPSPRSAAYAKTRRDGIPYNQIYFVLLIGAIGVSTWTLLSQHISSNLPSHGPHSSNTMQSWDTNPTSSSTHDKEGASVGQRRHTRKSSLLAAVSWQFGANGTLPQHPAAAAARPRGAHTLLAFQRTKTALPFIMLTCRMCGDPVSISVQRHKLYDAVTSTLLEHALSNASDTSRVFIEIGPGTGYFSMLAASWMSDVVAFESSEATRVLLQRNAALHRDGRIKVVPYAVGAKTTLAAVLAAQTATNASNATNTTAATKSTNSSNSSSSNVTAASSSSSSKQYGVDVVSLSDAISGDASLTVLLVNAANLDGTKVPDVFAVAEGAHRMLKHVQWLFVLGLSDHGSPKSRDMMAGVLSRGNFSNVYNYGPPSQQQKDDAEYEPGKEPGSAAVDVVPYPADTHYIDITRALQVAEGAAVQFSHDCFVFTRTPLTSTLTITMPKQVVWDWSMFMASNSTDNSTAANATVPTAGTSAQGQQAASAAAAAAAQGAVHAHVGAADGSGGAAAVKSTATPTAGSTGA